MYPLAHKIVLLISEPIAISDRGQDKIDLSQGGRVVSTSQMCHFQVLLGTAKHKLRLYDVRHGRRPVLDISFGEARITALAPESDGETL